MMLVGLCAGLWSASGLLQKLEEGQVGLPGVPGLDQLPGLQDVASMVEGTPSEEGPAIITPEGDEMTAQERKRLMAKAQALAPIPLDREQKDSKKSDSKKRRPR